MTGYREWHKNFGSWYEGEQKKKEKQSAEDKAAIKLLLGMKRRTSVPLLSRERMAELMVSEAKKRIGLLGWDPRNGDRLSPYFTKTRIGIAIEPRAIFLLYQNNGLKEFVPWGIQKYLDEHKGKIPFLHQTKLTPYEKVRQRGTEKIVQNWANRKNGSQYIFKEAPWLPFHYAKQREITNGSKYDKYGNLIQEAYKKVGEPATIHKPVGYALVPSKKARYDWGTVREHGFKAGQGMQETEAYKKWSKEHDELAKEYDKQEKRLEEWSKKGADKNNAQFRNAIAKTKHTREDILGELRRRLHAQDAKLLQHFYSQPEQYEQYKGKREVIKAGAVKMHKIILWRSEVKEKWFGHNAVKGLHFLDRAILDVVRRELGPQGKYGELGKANSASKREAKENAKEFTVPNLNGKGAAPSIHSREWAERNGQSGTPNYLPSRIVTNYTIPAIYIQI